MKTRRTSWRSHRRSAHSLEEQAFYGRRALRKLHGQDPVVHRHLFTPPKRQLPPLQWPSNEEAESYVKRVRLALGAY